MRVPANVLGRLAILSAPNLASRFFFPKPVVQIDVLLLIPWDSVSRSSTSRMLGPSVERHRVSGDDRRRRLEFDVVNLLVTNDTPAPVATFLNDPIVLAEAGGFEANTSRIALARSVP